MKNQIELTQSPIIKHDLVAVGASVTKRIAELNVENLVATEDTIKSMKALRAELNKEATEFETQRKAVKEAVNSPYSEFESVYNSEVKDKYKSAVNILKDKIGAFEIKIKEEKKDNIKRYFEELCLSEKIDFVKFSQLNIKIDLSTSEKKYKEFCNEFIDKVKEDVKLVESEGYQAEIMAEYKATLNVSKAITDVRARKAAEKLERERILNKRTMERQSLLRGWGMAYYDMAKAFVLGIDDTISVKQCDVELFSDEDWKEKCIVLDLRIKEAQAKTRKPEQEKSTNTVTEIKKPLEKPLEVKEEEKFTAKFEVEASMTALKGLVDHMKAQRIKYTTIN